jgi:hypothetical protein
MFTVLRRLFWLGLLGTAGYAAWTVWQRQAAPAPAAAPEWPPMPVPSGDATTPAAGDGDGDGERDRDVSDTAVAVRWMPPVDGACPEGYPVKANDNSGIYHVPGGRFYDRTVPERCYADTDDAEADGYRAAKA